MPQSELRRKILGRRSVRARIALACAGLFLVTGGAFVAATYTLVDHSLAVDRGHQPEQQSISAVVRACIGRAKRHTHRRPSGQVQTSLRRSSPSSALPCNERTTFTSCSCGPWSVSASPPSWPACWDGRSEGGSCSRSTRSPAPHGAPRKNIFDERIGLDGPDDELKELADTFDDMLDRLDLAFASQRRFVANASHELRTPLTSMRTLIDVAMAKPTRTTEGLETVVGRVREALDQSEAIIDGLLTLARSDRGLTTRELVDLEAAAQDAIDQTSTSARASNIVIEADLSAAPTLGDRVLVERLVANLVDNAVRYNVTGGSVQVETGTDHGQSYLSVTNTGPLVPELEGGISVRTVHPPRPTSRQRPRRRARAIHRRLGRSRPPRPPPSRRPPRRRTEDNGSVHHDSAVAPTRPNTSA